MSHLQISQPPPQFKSKIHQNKDWNTPERYNGIPKRTFKSKIHQNKDWNSILVSLPKDIKPSLRAKSIKTRIETRERLMRSCITIYGLRAKSIKTRIETDILKEEQKEEIKFKSKIHQNKDWNSAGLVVVRLFVGLRAKSIKTRIETKLFSAFSLYQNPKGLRAKSIKTRIETSRQSEPYLILFGFKSKIHQNKDWNSYGGVGETTSARFKSKIHQNKDWNFTMIRLPQ